MSENFEYNDGGRYADGFNNEWLDCTVRAYALARGILYKQSHVLFEQAGRQNRKGFTIIGFMKKHHSNMKRIKFDKPRPKVKTLLKKQHLKNAIVRISRHCFCVKNNIILDTYPDNENCIVLDIWIFD